MMKQKLVSPSLRPVADEPGNTWFRLVLGKTKSSKSKLESLVIVVPSSGSVVYYTPCSSNTHCLRRRRSRVRDRQESLILPDTSIVMRLNGRGSLEIFESNTNTSAYAWACNPTILQHSCRTLKTVADCNLKMRSAPRPLAC